MASTVDKLTFFTVTSYARWLTPAGFFYESAPMYWITRWILRLSVMLAAYSLALIGLLTWPWSGIAVAAVNAIRWARRSQAAPTTLGRARFATQSEMQNAGMLNGGNGLMIGRIPVEKKLICKITGLFNPRLKARQTCLDFMKLFDRNPSALIRLNQSIHTCTFAPSGAGKSKFLVVGFLKSCLQSVVCIDFKGELAKLTAEHRRDILLHETKLLDPYKVVTDKPDTFNPIDSISADSPKALDQCFDLAKALVIRNPEEKEAHWSDSAELWIAAFIALVVLYGERGKTRSLQTVKDLLSSPERIDQAIASMLESTAWEGMLARIGGTLRNYVDRERSSVLSTISRMLKFLDTPIIAANTETSSFSFDGLNSGKQSVFLILPPEHMRSASPLLRVWICCAMKAVIQNGLQEENLVHMVLDEAASLGQMDAIDDAVDKYRGYGIRLQFYFQSMGQLRRSFPNGMDQNLLSNTTQIYFSVNEYTTAEVVSNRLGEYTAIVESGGWSSGSSHTSSNGASPQQSTGSSTNNSRNWSLSARRLLKPEEIMTLPPNIVIAFAPKVPPIWSVLIPHYSMKWGAQRQSWRSNLFQSLRLFLFSLFIFSICTLFAVVMTAAIGNAISSPTTSY